MCFYLFVFWLKLQQFQVEASTNKVSDQQMPSYDLPSKILCRVVNVQLKVMLLTLNTRLFFCEWRFFFFSFLTIFYFQAESDTDEVFAQVTLLPLPKVSQRLIMLFRLDIN